jgi:hypothetical protein
MHGIRLSDLSKMPQGERERALGALVERAKGKPNGQIKALDAEIGEFEIRYQMTSDKMRAAFAKGEIRDTADIAKWLILLQVRDCARG